MLRSFRPVALLGGLLLVCSLPVRAQTYTVLCPDQTGIALQACLRAAYSTSATYRSTYSYARARDTLFAYVDDGDRALITDLYAGRTLPIPPGADPTIAGCNGDGDNNSSSCNGALNFNTEHLYPQSKGASTSSVRGYDLHHLYPARADVNSARGNNPFAAFADAQASTFYRGTEKTSIPPADADAWSATSTALDRFRPRAEVRGDVARAIFYFYTIYRADADAADPAFFDLQKDDLLAWHRADPPDAAEQARSARVRQYQGNDNPFALDTSLVVRAYFPDQLPTSAYADEGTAPDDAPLAFTVHGTTLRLSVREAQVVRVEAFDVLGRRVATLVEAALGAGETRELRLEAGHLAAGVYVLRATGATAARSRLIVVR